MEITMSFTLSTEEIKQVFVGMDLPLIERGMDEIQTAKDRMFGTDVPTDNQRQPVGQLIISNGTASSLHKKTTNAELERRTR